MNKLSVATRSGVLSKKSQSIIKCMQSYPEGITPKKISLLTSINVNTVKSIIPKLADIQKIGRGFYKVYNGGDGALSSTPDALLDWNFHNCIMSCQIPHKYFGNFQPVKKTINLNLIIVEFRISQKGRVTLRVATDYPLNVSSICMVYGLLCELLKKHTLASFAQSEVFIRTIEFNKDYSNLRLDGLNCITVDNLVEQFKLYQKKRGLRIEHKTKVPLTVENIVDMLSSNPNSIEHTIKLADQKKQLDRLTTATSANTHMLYKLIDNLEVKE